MSKLFIANENRAVERNISANRQFYQKYNYLYQDGISAVFYEKKIYSLGNTYRDGAGNFIGIVGSYLYKERFGIAAARSILEDFDGDVARMKKCVQGMFSAFILKDGRAVVFNDYYGLYDTYYHINETGYSIATSLKDVLLEMPDVSIEQFPFILEIFHTGCFDRETSFKNVFKLVGRNYLVIADGKVTVQWITDDAYRIEVPSYTDADSAIEYIVNRIGYYASCVSRNFDHIALGMTGGLDSRTVLAAYAASTERADITLFYGKGNSLLTPTCKEDDEIVRQIAREYEFPLQYMNWQHPEASEGVDWEYQQNLAEQYGFWNRVYAGNRNFFEEVEGKVIGESAFWDFGYFLEACRLREWAENKGTDVILLDEFLKEYFIDKKLATCYDNQNSFYEYVKGVFRERLSDAKEVEMIALDKFERFRWNTARYSDSRLYVLMNDFTYSYPLFSVPCIHEMILGLPAEAIMGGKFQIALLRKLNAGMLRIPIFSHRRKYHLTVEGDKKMDVNFKNIMSRVLLKVPRLSKPVLGVYRRVRYRDYMSNYDKVQMQLSDLQDEDVNDWLHVRDYPNGNIRALYNLRQFLIAYHIVKEERV